MPQISEMMVETMAISIVFHSQVGKRGGLQQALHVLERGLQRPRRRAFGWRQVA